MPLTPPKATSVKATSQNRMPMTPPKATSSMDRAKLCDFVIDSRLRLKKLKKADDDRSSRLGKLLMFECNLDDDL